MSIEHATMMALDAQHENRSCSDCELDMPKTENKNKVKKPVCFGRSCVHYDLHLDSEGTFAGGCMWDKGGYCGNYEGLEVDYIGDPYEFFND